jgi:hypothetical protein
MRYGSDSVMYRTEASDISIPHGLNLKGSVIRQHHIPNTKNFSREGGEMMIYIILAYID